MKNRRLALENLVSNGGGFDLFVRESSRNLSFASPFLGVRLADNSSDSNNDDSNNGPYTGGIPNHFNPSMAIIIVVLLSAFFFMGFFSIYVRRCAGEDDSLRNSRRRDSRSRGPRRREEVTRGLDRAVIESFPVFSYDLVKGLKTHTKDTLECAVCLNEYEDDEELRLLPKCSHAFHPDCIDTWLSSHTTCPVCRISLLPTDEDNPTSTGYGIIEASEITPPEETTIVVDEARRNGSVHWGNDVQVLVAPESADSQDSLGVMGVNRAKNFRRSHSTGHSLVRLRKDLYPPATEWYIATAEGLTPGLHRNCSLTARPRLRSQGSKSRPALSKQDSLRGANSFSGEDETSSVSGSGRRWYERGLRSERLSISSMNPSLFLRTYSEHRAPSYFRQQGSSADFSGSQRERRAYLPSLKQTLKRFTGRDRELTDISQSGRGSSSRVVVDESGGSITNAKEAQLGIQQL